MTNPSTPQLQRASDLIQRLTEGENMPRSHGLFTEPIDIGNNLRNMFPMNKPDFVKVVGLPLLAHRLRRASDALIDDVGELLSRLDVRIPPRAGSLVMLLASCAELPVMVAAQRLGLSHTMVINLARVLNDVGLVEDVSDPQDSRRRLLRLTDQGREQALFLGDLNRALSAAYGQMFEEAGINLFAALEAFEQAAARRSVLDRTAAMLGSTGLGSTDHGKTSP